MLNVLVQLLDEATPRWHRAIEREWPYGPHGDMPGPEAFLCTAIAWAAMQHDFDVFPEASYGSSTERMDFVARTPEGQLLALEFKMVGGRGRPNLDGLVQVSNKLTSFSRSFDSSRICFRGLVIGSWNEQLTDAWQAVAAETEPRSQLAANIQDLLVRYEVVLPRPVWTSAEQQSFHLLVASLAE
ncbi:hypothetical protein HS125_21345 [bacterium]|nr:hypothetical protein [bacterium]